VTTREALVAAIRESPTDATLRKVFADYLEEYDAPQLARLVRIGMIGPINRGGDGGYGYGGDGYGGYGGDGYGGYGGDGGDGGYGGYGDGGGDGVKILISEGLTMTDGMYIITIAAGYSPYVMIGWAEVGDLFVTFRNCRVIRKFGSRANLAVIAKKGPQSDTELLAPSECEYIGIAMIGRAIPCVPANWRKECPEPKLARETTNGV
jgi:uncharacterized protein (TIGR02996 family)